LAHNGYHTKFTRKLGKIKKYINRIRNFSAKTFNVHDEFISDFFKKNNVSDNFNDFVAEIILTAITYGHISLLQYMQRHKYYISDANSELNHRFFMSAVINDRLNIISFMVQQGYRPREYIPNSKAILIANKNKNTEIMFKLIGLGLLSSAAVEYLIENENLRKHKNLLSIIVASSDLQTIKRIQSANIAIPKFDCRDFGMIQYHIQEYLLTFMSELHILDILNNAYPGGRLHLILGHMFSLLTKRTKCKYLNEYLHLRKNMPRKRGCQSPDEYELGHVINLTNIVNESNFKKRQFIKEHVRILSQILRPKSLRMQMILIE
jgi:hypothetical protein